MRKLLYILSILCTISTFSIAQVNSMSLGKALSSSDLELEFNPGGTIWCEYANGSGFPYPGFIDKKEYEYSGNTYYIPVNTVELVRNTCRGGGNIPSLFASIKGSENISLQNWSSNNIVFKEIIFAGNNSSFTGTMHFHPSISDITFKYHHSVISNININNSITNVHDNKNIKQSIVPSNQKTIYIYFPDGCEFGILNVDCNSMICLMHPYKQYIDISFTEIKNPNNKLWYSDKVHIITNKYYNNKRKCLRDINITDSNSKQKQSSNSNANSIQPFIPPVSLKDQIVSELKKYIDVQINKMPGTIASMISSTGSNGKSILLQNAIKDIIYKSIITTVPSYLTFHAGHVDVRKRLWNLYCSNCSNPICKFEVDGAKTYDREGIQTVTYDGTIYDLKLKMSNEYICKKCNMLNTPITIHQYQISTYQKYISKNNCIYTGEWGSPSYFGTYDLYCNKCGYHTPSINHGTNALLNGGQAILDAFKTSNNNSDKCTKCKKTFDKDTFTPTKIIKQSIVTFSPFDANYQYAWCNFVEHNSPHSEIILSNLEQNKLTDNTLVIKRNLIGAIHGSGCEARLVGTEYYGQDSKYHYVDVDDCTIKEDEDEDKEEG